MDFEELGGSQDFRKPSTHPKTNTEPEIGPFEEEILFVNQVQCNRKRSSKTPNSVP